MAFRVRREADDIVVALGGIDRLLCWRREVRIPLAHVDAVRRAPRSEVERRLDHRVFGVGSHRGEARRRRRRRVGAFVGRAVGGAPQFWAVRRGTEEVVLVDAPGARFPRLVVDAIEGEAVRVSGS